MNLPAGQALGGWIVHDGELSLPQTLDLVTQPRGFLEVEIGGGGAHAAFEVGQHGFEVVPDGAC